MGARETSRERSGLDEPSLDAAMNRYAEGDASAFRELHHALSPRLSAFFVRLTASPALADDLAQETFLRVHRARGTFATHAAVVPWVYAIARNAWLDHARAAKHRRTEPLTTERDSGDFTRDPEAAPDANGELSAIAADLARVVERTLQGLPPAQREAFVLLRYEGLSVQEAAAVLGTTVSAVKLRAFRAYEAVRAALGRASAPPPSAP